MVLNNYILSNYQTGIFSTSHEQEAILENIEPGIFTTVMNNVIYIINDNVCKISSVGYTADNMKTRFTNHKSHIKYNKRLCELSKHFSENLILHTLDKSSHLKYDNSLKENIGVIIVEKVDVSEVGTDIESVKKKLKEREWYWQNNLKTLRQYGGLNIREESWIIPWFDPFCFF